MSKQSLPMCASCGQFGLRPDIIDWTLDVPHDGKKHTITARRVPVLRCGTCHEVVFGPDAQPVIRAAVREHLGLLAPETVRANRKRLRYKQSELAEIMGCSSAWLSRLEKDRLIQSRVHDRFLRLLFEHAAVRSDLARIVRGDSTVGLEVGLPNTLIPSRVLAVQATGYKRQSIRMLSLSSPGFQLMPLLSPFVDTQSDDGAAQRKVAA